MSNSTCVVFKIMSIKFCSMLVVFSNLSCTNLTLELLAENLRLPLRSMKEDLSIRISV